MALICILKIDKRGHFQLVDATFTRRFSQFTEPSNGLNCEVEMAHLKKRNILLKTQ